MIYEAASQEAAFFMDLFSSLASMARLARLIWIKMQGLCTPCTSKVDLWTSNLQPWRAKAEAPTSEVEPGTLEVHRPHF